MDEPSLYERMGGRPVLSRVVKWFYAKARFDPVLEPIFKAHIPVWSVHLNVIIDFWARMIGGPSTWSGGMGRHFSLHLEPEHYAIWLRIWEQNCHDLLPPREAAELSAMAHRLGGELQTTMARAAARQAVAPTSP